MLTINLLPEENRKNICLERYRRVILFFGGALSLVFILGSILLLPSFLPMFFERSEVERELALEKDAYKKMGIESEVKNIQTVAQNIDRVALFVSLPPRASSLSRELLVLAPAGIRVGSLSINKKGDVTIAGLTDTRQSLLDFQEALRGTRKFKEIHSPLPNIVRGAADFVIQGQIKEESGL